MTTDYKQILNKRAERQQLEVDTTRVQRSTRNMESMQKWLDKQSLSRMRK